MSCCDGDDCGKCSCGNREKEKIKTLFSHECLYEITKILNDQTYIHFSLGNDSSAWKGEWVVNLNMMDGKGIQCFHGLCMPTALQGALIFLNDYYKRV